jgi:hypothetical protein
MSILAGIRGGRLSAVAVIVLTIAASSMIAPAPVWAFTPLEHVASLTASDPVTTAGLGRAIAMSPEVIVAGAPGLNDSPGTVYVFARDASGWSDGTQVAKLTASDRLPNDGFGRSVGISGDTIVVGAPGSSNLRGAVYVYEKPATGWADATETAKLTASDGADSDVLGASVAIDDGTVVAGAPIPESGALRPGAVYVFEKPATGWANATQTAKLTASDAVNWDHLGQSVAISAGTVVAGATGDDIDGHFSQGSLYVYEKPVTGWAGGTETAKLTASDGLDADVLGSSVAVSGDVIVSGAPCRDRVSTASFSCQSQSETDEGGVYLFTKPAAGWTTGNETALLESTSASQHLELGTSVAIDGDLVVAGAPFGAGLVDVFDRPATGWADMTETQSLHAALPNQSNFGGSVGTLAGLVGVGVGDLQNYGSVSVFEPPPADLAAPVTTITVAPTSPDGAAGWYVTAPTLAVSAADEAGGSGVANTRCALDPVAPPATFADLPSSCAYMTATAVTGDGVHTLYAASDDAAGNTEALVSTTFSIDRTPPTVTCAAAPSYSLRGPGGTVTATVGDSTSGPASTSVSTAVDVSAAGRHNAVVTGYDLAGNTTAMPCDFLVRYVVTVDSPSAGRAFKAGSPIKTSFSVRDASGAPIAGSEAQAMSSTCRATVRLDEGARSCATYNTRAGSFSLSLRTLKSAAAGSHTLWVEILVGTDYVNAEQVLVNLR